MPEPQQSGVPDGWEVVGGAGAPPPTTPQEATPDADRPVTLGDLRADPMAAMTRIGQILKKDATDPKIWMALAASYFAPKMLSAVLPVVSRAATATRQAVTSPAARDMATLALGEGRVNAGVRLAQRLGRSNEPPASVPAPPQSLAGNNLSQAVQEAVASGRLRAKPSESTPVSVPAASPVASPPAAATAPIPSAPDTTAPQSSVGSAPRDPRLSPARIQNELALTARRAKLTLTTDEYKAAEQAVRSGQSIEEALATVKPQTAATSSGVPKAKLLSSEVPEYLKLIRAGKSPAQAYEAIQAQRDFAQAYGLSTPTGAEKTFPKGMRGKTAPSDGRP